MGDGALGFWAALRDVFPATKEQRCWVHKTANVVDALPKRLQPQAKSAIQAIYNAGSRTEALTAAKSITSPTQLDAVTPPAQVAPVPRPAGRRLANTGYQLPDVGSWGRR